MTEIKFVSIRSEYIKAGSNNSALFVTFERLGSLWRVISGRFKETIRNE